MSDQPVSIREINQQRILNLIRLHPGIWRAQIVKETDLGKATVSTIVSKFIDALMESETLIGAPAAGEAETPREAAAPAETAMPSADAAGKSTKQSTTGEQPSAATPNESHLEIAESPTDFDFVPPDVDAHADSDTERFDPEGAEADDQELRFPDDPSLVVHFNSPSLIGLAQANMTEEEYEKTLEWSIFEVFDAISLGLQLDPDGLGGVVYFFLAD